MPPRKKSRSASKERSTPARHGSRVQQPGRPRTRATTQRSSRRPIIPTTPRDEPSFRITNQGKKKLDEIWDYAVLHYLAREAGLRNGHLTAPNEEELRANVQGRLYKTKRDLGDLRKYISKGYQEGKDEADAVVRNCLAYGLDMGVLQQQADGVMRIDSVAGMYMQDVRRFPNQPGHETCGEIIPQTVQEAALSKTDCESNSEKNLEAGSSKPKLSRHAHFESDCDSSDSDSDDEVDDDEGDE